MVLFELCHAPFGTAMERHMLLQRARDLKFPRVPAALMLKRPKVVSAKRSVSENDAAAARATLAVLSSGGGGGGGGDGGGGGGGGSSTPGGTGQHQQEEQEEGKDGHGWAIALPRCYDNGGREILGILRGLLAKEPEKRPSASELVVSEWNNKTPTGRPAGRQAG